MTLIYLLLFSLYAGLQADKASDNADVGWAVW
jgi:hypothetical protein